MEPSHCPKCGEEMKYSKSRCMSCGHSMFDDAPDPNSYSENMRRNSLETREFAGLLFSVGGLFCFVLGILGLWNSDYSPFEPPSPQTQIAIMLFGLGWIAGGVIIFRGYSWGCWFLQIQNISTIGAIVYTQEWEMLWILVVLAPLARFLVRVQKVLYEAEPVMKSQSAEI